MEFRSFGSRILNERLNNFIYQRRVYKMAIALYFGDVWYSEKV